MITIVIADDEKIIREGLAKILTDSLELPLRLLEAKNGQEALELCAGEHPDVLITDIKMPVMDGVELMTRLNAPGGQDVLPQIIVLSGFDDFSYAKAALKNGALTYILKPVDKKELIAAVNDAIRSSQQQAKARNEKLLHSVVDGGKIDYTFFDKEFYAYQGLFYVSVCGPQALAQTNAVLDRTKFYLIEQKPTFTGLVFAWQGSEPFYDKSILDRHVVGVSAQAENLSQVRTVRRQSQIALIKAFFEENGAVAHRRLPGMYFYKDSEPAPDFSELDREYERLVSMLDIATAESLQKSLSVLADFSVPEGKTDPRDYNAEKVWYLYQKITSDLFYRFSERIESDMYLYMKSIMIEDLTSLQSLADWISCVSDFVLYMGALLKRSTKESPYITEALAYIKTHFKKNINMAMVANQVSVNYTWFSEKFKESVGMNFNEYLKRLRIAEAKRLLEKGCYKVYEVSEHSGFSDVKYFMRIFKEETGLPPSEWAKRRGMDGL